MPLKEKVCTTTKDIQPCVSLAQVLNPIRPYDMAVRCRVLGAIAQWQNQHAPLSYLDKDNADDIKAPVRPPSNKSPVTSTYGAKLESPDELQMSSGPDVWLDPQKLWTRHSPYELITPSSSSNKKSSKTAAVISNTLSRRERTDSSTTSEKVIHGMDYMH